MALAGCAVSIFDPSKISENGCDLHLICPGLALQWLLNGIGQEFLRSERFNGSALAKVVLHSCLPWVGNQIGFVLGFYLLLHGTGQVVGFTGFVCSNSSRPDGITLKQQAINRNVRRGGDGYDPEPAVAGVINQEAAVTIGGANNDATPREVLGGLAIGHAESVHLLR